MTQQILEYLSQKFKKGQCAWTKTGTQITALFVMVQDWKRPKYLSMGEWLNKHWYIHTRKWYSAINRNQFITYTIWYFSRALYLVKKYPISKAYTL